jgi:hypothetical protein
MNIAPQHVAAIQAFGYTESEAQFLYIVATHSGYFVPRQFLSFIGAKWGKRTTRFAEKIESRGHAAWREYPTIGGVYHLFAKKLYGEIEKENIRNRRQHSLEFIQTRLVLLDFVLANQHYDYFETEKDKLSYFSEQLQIPTRNLPARTYIGSSRTEPTLRYFVDKYPLFLDCSFSPPVVTLSYVDPGHASIAGFTHHLRAYSALFQALGDFHFFYISNTRAHFVRAAECFSSLVNNPRRSHLAADVVRYFRLRQAWERKEYATLSNDDIEWLRAASDRFQGAKYTTIYDEWTLGRITDRDLEGEFPETTSERSAAFRTHFVAASGGGG